MNFVQLPNLVSRNYYHYLVNRRRRRLTIHAQAACIKHFSVITNLYLLNSIWLLFILISNCSLSNAVQIPTHQALVDPFKSSSSLSTTHCIIGRLRQCFEDEDCVENAGPEVKVVVSNRNVTEDVVHSATIVSKSTDSGNVERTGTCTCRLSQTGGHTRQRCKRTQQSPQIVPIGERGRLADQRTKQSGHLGWIIGTLIALTVIGGCGFAIYYYGIRYNMIRNIARRLGLTDNTQVEHQLLNRIPSGADEEAELAI